MKSAETLGAVDHLRMKGLQLKGGQLLCWHKEGYELNLARICLGTELVSYFLSCMQLRMC